MCSRRTRRTEIPNDAGSTRTYFFSFSFSCSPNRESPCGERERERLRLRERFRRAPMRFFTLTCNLLAETTYTFDAWTPGATQRARDETFQVGGKGINV